MSGIFTLQIQNQFLTNIFHFGKNDFENPCPNSAKYQFLNFLVEKNQEFHLDNIFLLENVSKLICSTRGHALYFMFHRIFTL